MLLRKASLATLCLFVSGHAALAACADARDISALKVASLQQRLMVAGLTCHAGEAYNRFVLAHRAELQRSDDDLKAYFVRNGGEAGYDAYKTRAANLAAHGPATNQDAFCAVARKDFQTLASSGDLQLLAGYEALTAGKACEASPVLAANRPETAPEPVRVASADIVTAPSRALPAMPYADVPPPMPMPQPVAAAPAEMMEAPRMAALPAREEAPPPRAADPRGSRYWYYRRLYRDYYRRR
jgi:hypothetical protein